MSTAPSSDPLFGRRDFVNIPRPRVLACLEAPDDSRVRVLCAPPGSGRTSALLQYAAQNSGIAMVTLPPGATKKQVTALFAGVGDAREIVVDDADLAAPGGREALLEEVAAKGAGRRYLLAGYSRSGMLDQHPLEREAAQVIDASFLSFTSSEIRRLIESNAVAAEDSDVEQLEHETDGWPLAVASIVRDAVRDGCSLGRTLESWSTRNSRWLLAHVGKVLGSGENMAAFLAAARNAGDPASQRTFERLERAGYPIVRMRARLRPYRVLAELADEAPNLATELLVDDRLLLKLFGRFSCTIQGRAVEFARRRDRSVLAFVALAPGGSVKRSALHNAFWRNATPAAAAQGLRTTLSHLRSAIADAGECHAERFLRSDERISLSLERVSVDTRDFTGHIAAARAAQDAGKTHVARDHYRQAERLHVDSLLASEAIEPCLAPQVSEYATAAKLAAAQAAALDARLKAAAFRVAPAGRRPGRRSSPALRHPVR